MLLSEIGLVLFVNLCKCIIELLGFIVIELVIFYVGTVDLALLTLSDLNSFKGEKKET